MNANNSLRAAAAVFLASLAAGAQEGAPERTFRTTVNIVVAPVTVLDKQGRYVNGLEAKDFSLYDNEKAQEIKLDVSFVPISLVVAIQRNANVETVLPKIKHIGPLLEGLVIGQAGEAALLAFDHRIELIQDFSSDGRLFTQALEKLRPGSSSSRMIDAVFEATRLLRRRPQEHRRILLLISETRDIASEGRLREALLEAQIHNIIVYTININRLVTALTSKGQPPRWDPFPSGARPLPPGAPRTPGSVAQLTGLQGNAGNFVPLLVEMFRQVKSIFFDNPAEVFTKYTGGREYSFLTQGDLERVVSHLGEELHSQYLLSYNPSNKQDGGWHDIRVDVARFGVEVRTRPGYWMASVP